MERPIKIRILDQEYLIKTDGEEEDVQRIVGFVNEKLQSIIDATGGTLEKKTALLAAFYIASDYYQLMKERDNLVKIVQNRARQLNEHIKSALDM